MPLHAVMAQLQQIEILGCNVSADDGSYAEKKTGLGQLPAELLDAHSNNVGPRENIDSKTPRKKKNRGKNKSGRKFAKVFPKDQCTFDAIQPRVWMKWAKVKPAENNSLYSFVNGERRDIPCLESDIHCRVRHSHDATQLSSTRKRNPVWKKKVKHPKNTVVPIEPKDGNVGKNRLHLQGPKISTKDALIEAQKVQPAKDHHQPFHVPESFRHLFVNAKMAEHAFVASYRLQVACESLQQATGYPIAEFERLICYASPFIAFSSFSCHSQEKCLDIQPCIPSLSKHQIPNISLQSIWNWYEEPGNYGLKVIVDDPQKQKSCFADTSSFDAHFVPLLSAIQLFGKEANSQSSFSGDPIFLSSLKASCAGNTLVDTVNTGAMNDHISDVYVNDRKELSSQPALLNNANLIFEFFESEQPQRRLPLYNKIIELANGGAANNQVFGDPSKLVCTNLDDLHPASWFSVAWYPIYRIPEGKLCAAFLTYHSLGYVVQRCMKNDSIDKSNGGVVVLPIIGLQSYNAQGELWFSPNSEAESPFRELTCRLVKERLGILEENALGFARGMVSKDNATVTNRQPDYEFFMSRKQ